MKPIVFPGLAALIVCSIPLSAVAVPIGHHGQMIIHCTPPQFFDENPAKDVKVAALQRFTVTASDDADPETIKLWVNNQPVKPEITRERSGRYHIEGSLPAGTAGRVWLKAEGYSHEGCDEYKSWFIQVGS